MTTAATATPAIPPTPKLFFPPFFFFLLLFFFELPPPELDSSVAVSVGAEEVVAVRMISYVWKE